MDKHICGSGDRWRCKKCDPDWYAKLSVATHYYYEDPDGRAKTGAAIRAVGDRRREERWGYSWLRQRGGRWEVRFPWSQQWVRQARVVWVQAHGPIPPGHDIHHINGDKLNDHLENLMQISHNNHVGLHNTLGGTQ